MKYTITNEERGRGNAEALQRAVHELKKNYEALLRDGKTSDADYTIALTANVDDPPKRSRAKKE